MIIHNTTSSVTISSDAKLVESIKDQLFGLLIKSNPRCLIFKTRFGIHTFGLSQPIDVLVLNSQNKVVKLKKNLQPNRLFFWNPKFNLIIELPQRKTNQTKTKLADKIKIY